MAAVALDRALTDLADLLANRFVDAPRENREQVFAAFGADHAVEIA